MDNDNAEDEDSILESQDSTFTSKNTSEKTKPEPVSESEVLERKSFSERWKTNRFWLISGSYHVLRSVWMVAMFIGGLIVWLISFLFI